MDNFVAERQSDKVLHVEFYTDALHSAFQSAEQGRPVFNDVDMIRIIAPGDKNNIIETKVDITHQQRFPDKYKRFKEGQTQGISGWILKEWPAVTASQVKELNYHEIHTVEQLAALSDGSVSKLGMGMQELRTKAKAALAAAAGNAQNEQAAVEMQRMADEIESLKALLKQPATSEDSGKTAKSK